MHRRRHRPVIGILNMSYAVDTRKIPQYLTEVKSKLVQ